MTSLRDTYRGRRVLVTGDTGFKGSWLSEWLTSLGAQVTGYALDPPTEPSLFEALGLAGRIDHVRGDVRDADQVSATVQAAQPAVIFHLAALATVLGAYAAPRETFETNVIGTINVLDAARACPAVRAVVVVTSDKVYQNAETGFPFRETDPLGGSDPYAASKAAAELATAAYRASYFTAPDAAAVATVRAGNVIGGGDWAADRIVPDAVRALTAGQPITVRNPDAIRPWQHVLEPLSGYVWLAARMLRDGHDVAGAWNFGPQGQGEQPVHWVVERFLEAWGSGSWTTPSGVGPAFHEAQRLSLDSSKARDRLGWAPVWDAREAVDRTAAWYRGFLRDPAAARALVDEQLRAYQDAAHAAGLPWAAEAESRP